jgi:hypothetical protein
MRRFMEDGGEMVERTTAWALAAVLTRAEHMLGLPHDPAMLLWQRVERVIRAAQSGRLDPRSYRIMWMMRKMDGRHG